MTCPKLLPVGGPVPFSPDDYELSTQEGASPGERDTPSSRRSPLRETLPLQMYMSKDGTTTKTHIQPVVPRHRTHQRLGDDFCTPFADVSVLAVAFLHWTKLYRLYRWNT